MDLGQAATGAGHGGVQAGQLLVGGDAHQHVEALAHESVGEVQQSGQVLTRALLGLDPDQLVAVLEHEELPAIGWFRTLLVGVQVVVVDDHTHQVRG